MFVSVVRIGSLSAAAAKTHVPLATLSRRVRDLERELGVQLLARSARGIKLTDAGERLYELASRGVDTLADAEQAVKSEQAKLVGRLRVSLPPSFEPWWELLRAFQEQHPGVEVSVYTTERPVDLIVDGIDVALRIGAVVHESMVARRLLRYRHVLVASPALVKRLGVPASPEALGTFPCGVWRRDLSGPTTWRLGTEVVQPSARLAVNDYLHLRARALAGDLVTELPPFLASECLEKRRLVPLLSDFPLPEREVNLLYPVNRHPSSIVAAYLRFCGEEVTRYLGPRQAPS